MEVGGIEPPSENPSARTSPITVDLLGFPPPNADQQALGFSSFIGLFLAQSFDRKVPRIVDAMISSSGWLEDDGRLN